MTEDVTLYPMRRFELDEWDNLVAYYALRVRARQRMPLNAEPHASLPSEQGNVHLCVVCLSKRT